MSGILLYGVIKFMFNTATSKNLRPLLIGNSAVNCPRIIFCFNNKNTVLIYNNMVNLTCFILTSCHIIIKYVLLSVIIFNNFSYLCFASLAYLFHSGLM